MCSSYLRRKKIYVRLVVINKKKCDLLYITNDITNNIELYKNTSAEKDR